MTPLPRQRFTEHLEALRHMLVRMAVAWLLGVSVVALHFGGLLELLKRPMSAIPGAQLITLSPLAGLFIGLNVLALGGTLVAAPLMLLYLLQFVAPALHRHEARSLGLVALLGVALFVGGAVVGFVWLLPVSLKIAFALQKTMGFELLWSAQEYFGLVVALPLMLGLGFCVPLVMALLMHHGILPHSVVAKRWDVALIAILVLAAAITPTGDPVTFLFIALPLGLLYALALVFGRPSSASAHDSTTTARA